MSGRNSLSGPLADPAGDAGLRRRAPAARRVLHRHLGLHRLQGLRGGLQGVERRARTTGSTCSACRTTTPARWARTRGGTSRSSSSRGRRPPGRRPGRAADGTTDRAVGEVVRLRAAPSAAAASWHESAAHRAGGRESGSRRSRPRHARVQLPGAGRGAEGRTEFRWLMASDVCKHCTHAGCLDVCPTGALFRTEFGTVVVQQDICNGCGYCVSGCPYGVIDAARRRRAGAEVHAVLRPAARRHGAGVRAGLPDRLDPVRDARRAAGAGATSGSPAARARGHRGPALRRMTRTTASAGTARSSCCSTSPRCTGCRPTRWCPPATAEVCGAGPRPRPACSPWPGSGRSVSSAVGGRR